MTNTKSTVLRGGPFDGQSVSIEQGKGGTVTAGPEKGKPVMVWPPCIDIPRDGVLYRYEQRAGASYYLFQRTLPAEAGAGESTAATPLRTARAGADLGGQSQDLGVPPSPDGAEGLVEAPPTSHDSDPAGTNPSPGSGGARSYGGSD